MGSCVSQCSGTVHQQQNQRANLNAEDSGKTTNLDDMQLVQNLQSPPMPHSIPDLTAKDIHIQIDSEIQALKAQLIRSHALLSYLQQSKGTLPSKDPFFEAFRHSDKFPSGHPVKACLVQQRSLDEQTIFPCHNYLKKMNSSSTSNKSTPLHYSYFAQSCPVLLGGGGGISVTSKAIQTGALCEPENGGELGSAHKSSHLLSLHEKEALHQGRKSNGLPTVPEFSSKSAENLECGVCEVYENENSSPCLPRLRTNSFLSAVRSGSSEVLETVSSIASSDYEQMGKSSASPSLEQEEPHHTSCNYGQQGDLKQNRDSSHKLPVLVEEDFKSFHTVGGHPQTKTDKSDVFLLCRKRFDTNSSSHEKNRSFEAQSTAKHNGRGCFIHQNHGLRIVKEMVEKKTAYSEKMSNNVRHPPPGSVKLKKCLRYSSSEDVSHQTRSRRSSKPMLKWATIPHSTPSKNGKLASNQVEYRARYFSADESGPTCSCCHHPGHEKSISHGDVNRTDVKEVHPNGNQKTSEVVNPAIEEIKNSSSKVDQRSEQAISKEKAFKTSQRSLRRGSGAGSPNSLTGIPRYPAFDLSEQDEDHSAANTIPKKQVVTFDKSVELHPVPKRNEDDEKVDSSPLCNRETSTRKQDVGKSSMLMPEALETSETESAKGSFEYEAPESHSNPEPPPIPVPEKAFPNLPNSLLVKLGINKESPTAVLDEHELESKFMTLALAFKTDKVTLPKRLEIQKRQRDIAEKDVESEINSIRESLNNLNLNATSAETRDLITKIQNHVDIVRLATSKVSARSETYGAVKQEERLSGAFEVMMMHVENLKRLFDKEHKELEETKQLLSGAQVSRREVGRADGTVEEHRKSLKTFGLAIGSIKSVVRRRASVAEFSHFSPPGVPKVPLATTHCLPSGVEVDSGSRLLNALSPLTSLHSVGSNSSSPCSPYSWSPSQVSGSRRCSLPVNQLNGSLLTSKNPGSKRKDSLSLNKSNNELKISMVPSLSPVVDEEVEESEPEAKQVQEPENCDANAEGQHSDMNCESAPEDDSSPQPDVKWEVQEISRSEEITLNDESMYNCESSDQVAVSEVAEKKYGLLERLGYSDAVHNVWETSSAVTLFRYCISFLLGCMAVIFLFVTFLRGKTRN